VGTAQCGFCHYSVIARTDLEDSPGFLLIHPNEAESKRGFLEVCYRRALAWLRLRLSKEKMRIGITLAAALAGMATAKAFDLQELLTRPERPARADVWISCRRPSLSEISDAVAAMQELKRLIQAARGKNRSEIRDEAREIREGYASIRREISESIEAARTQALDNSRKFKEDLEDKRSGKGR
jgi:hypothetical protein